MKGLVNMEKQTKLFNCEIAGEEKPDIIVVENSYFSPTGFVREKIIRMVYKKKHL